MRKEPYKAWRAWKVWETEEDSVYLSSTFQPTIWKPGEQLIAKCLAIRGGFFGAMSQTVLHSAVPAPHRKCMCGIYSTRTKKDLVKNWYLTETTKKAIRGNYSIPHGHVRVFGKVLLTGHVVVHEGGYRAQKATIYELFVNDRVKKYPMYAATGAAHTFYTPQELATKLRNIYKVDVSLVSV